MSELWYILGAFFFFLVTGGLGGLGIYFALNHRKKWAIRCFILGFIGIILFLVLMFAVLIN